jgi:outer membrane protein OmpA-like peptidoglycan-associated protein
MEREKELFDTGMIRLSNLSFATGKAELLPRASAFSTVVGQVLRRWPELKFEIGGHTDNRGADKENQRLSEARAKSVLRLTCSRSTPT